MANKENLKKFSINSFPEYSNKDIKKELKDNPISYLKILEKKNKNANFSEIKKRIQKFKKKDILIKKNASIYLYEQSDENKKYIGFICGVSTEDYKNGHIKIHEKTIKKRQKLFQNYLEKCKIHAEPILLTYEKNKQIENFIKKKRKEEAQYEFKTKDKKTHKIWTFSLKEDILKIKLYFEKIKKLFVADGHHRIASTSSYNDSFDIKNPCLGYLIDSDQLTLENFHRIIPKSKIYEKNALLCLLENNKDVKKTKKIFPIKKNEIKIYVNETWYSYKIKLNVKNEDTIPVFLLSNKILKPILKIKDLDSTEKINYIPNSKLNLDKILKKNNLIFLLPNIKIETILEVANNNKTMPPKSTYILPKLRTGLIIMELK